MGSVERGKWGGGGRQTSVCLGAEVGDEAERGRRLRTFHGGDIIISKGNVTYCISLYSPLS